MNREEKGQHCHEQESISNDLHDKSSEKVAQIGNVAVDPFDQLARRFGPVKIQIKLQTMAGEIDP